ncbi:nitrile hydratase subunit alpha [Haloferax sp. MBLA0076]|uniref:nitrile hydratase n=1 Tax=Haloferax litoreum TaxID=2666140 RepID=A0A6A8GKN8_9EURY|nr:MULTISPECIES: nitrile hydratase subunit alpha [Haloferax]KAB1190444.1 nitrile hydratase subunit alpha [Haloferax sp. CBA1148]MRX23419.1 nitrile hydratase subunit alpha [Haloferax litoreum]
MTNEGPNGESDVPLGEESGEESHSHSPDQRDEPHDSHDHSHDHHHTHHHSAEGDPNDPKERARALQSLLVEKGLVSTAAVDEVIAKYEHDIGPMNGARVVAKAWVDPEFKERLLADATTAIADEFDFELGDHHTEVVENTSEVHNVIVCTLCSCYPWFLLGLPPSWYKSPEYRSRLVREPRAVLSEFGLDLSKSVEVAVWDSTSDFRYMVLPERPVGTEDLNETELAELVTRDSMVGVETLEAQS